MTARRTILGILSACTALLAVLACATSPLGRSQLMLFPDSEMATMGVAAFDRMKSQTPQSTDPATIAYVRCVADAITAQVQPSQSTVTSWEVVVFEEPSANAFALPGGKIGVHTGLLSVATNQHQLAAVIGHEVAHVLAGHSNERVSTQFATQTGLQLASVLASGSGSDAQRLMGLLGVGAQYGIVLPFSRAQEKESDLVGLDLMARAGFDPRESVSLWENMARLSRGQAPPELMSTHPAPATRIAALEHRIPLAMPEFEKARAAGRNPACG